MTDNHNSSYIDANLLAANTAASKAEKAKAAIEKYGEIKSFVRHHGRLTRAQADALAHYLPLYQLDAEGKRLTADAFSREQVVLEIGFGNGETLIDMAKATPDTLFLGAEVHKPGIGHALLLAHAAHLENFKVIADDAVAFIDKRLPDACLDRVQIFFPDPWHKKRHFKRRLVQTAFIEKVHRVLKPNGYLHIATDWTPYAEHCLEVLNPSALFENQSKDNTYVAKPAYRGETKFERRGLRLGHEVHDLLFKKV